MNETDFRPEVSIVILNFRTPEVTARAANLLPEAAPGIRMETVIVDNGSGDGSAAAIRERCPTAQVIELSRNAGFAAGMNAGLRKCSGERILFLNSDIEALPGSLSELLGYVRSDPSVGLVAPLLVDESGNPTRTLLVEPTIWRTLIPALGKIRYKQWRKRIGTEPMDVEATEGAAFLVSRQAIERAGALDEEFFFYHEIVDLCVRIRDVGLRVVVVPSARMRHACGGSTGGVRAAAKVELKRSEYQLTQKRLGRAVSLVAMLRDVVSGLARCGLYGVLSLTGSNGAKEKLKAHGAVVWWMLAGMPGRGDRRYLSRLGGWD